MDLSRSNAVALRQAVLSLITGAFLAGSQSTQAIILARTGDPNANTTAPTNDPAASGWNYEGQWGGYLGTPIAPHFFAAAAHIGGSSGDPIVYGGVTYTTVAMFQDPFSDLRLWQISGTFPNFAPMYTKGDEVGQRIVAIGRGTQRGSEFYVGDVFRGWNWGAGDGRQRWGENIVSQIATDFPGPYDYVYADFDQNGLPDECHFSSGDSSGAVFINDGGVWKVAGINAGVTGYFYTDNMGGGQFIAALFNVGGFYYHDDATNQYVQFPDPSPTGIFCTRISSRQPFIQSVIDPNGIGNSDGLPNLLEYAKVLNGSAPMGYGTPIFTRNGNSLVITYRRITGNAALTYEVQQATNLPAWGPATTQENIQRTDVNVQTVQSTIALPPNAQQLFLQVKVTYSAPGQAAVSTTLPVVNPTTRRKTR